MAYPQSLWSFRHMEELGPAARIDRGSGPVDEFVRGEDTLGLADLTVEGDSGGNWDLAEFLRRTYTDALLVAHRGRLVHEWYADGMGPTTRHAMFSTTKTFSGLVALLAIHDGELALDDLLVDHVPELAGTGWEPVTVEQALDMTDGISFDEDYGSRDSAIMRYGFAMGFTPRGAAHVGRAVDAAGRVVPLHVGHDGRPGLGGGQGHRPALVGGGVGEDLAAVGGGVRRRDLDRPHRPRDRLGRHVRHGPRPAALRNDAGTGRDQRRRRAGPPGSGGERPRRGR
jgi:hypothetical protein